MRRGHRRQPRRARNRRAPHRRGEPLLHRRHAERVQSPLQRGGARRAGAGVLRHHHLHARRGGRR
ncbi:hypothetical protein D7Y15_30135 [Corallococcus sp. AB030]|nr:hypothetical protein D7Y15_30135 [Corallococcus sp. AB030]